MKLAIHKTILLLLVIFLWNTSFLFCQNIYDTLRTVKMTAIADPITENLTILWTDDVGDNSYQLFKKLPGQDNWGDVLMSSNNQDTFYVDKDVEKGELYEYRILKETGDSLGYGYLFSGVDYEPVQERGDVLILLEAAAQSVVQTNLNIYIGLLKSEGWNPKLELVPFDATVPEVKAIILESYENISNLNTVVLMGNIPVPHSGNINPDGHNDHRGAWPADVYYGEIDGSWTDERVTNTTSAYPRLHNVPGDGNFDQDYIPGKMELAVGRLDFSELPVFSSNDLSFLNLNEYELLDRYLEKNIAFRNGQYPVRRRAVFKNRNPWREGLGQNAIRNFVPLVSNDSIVYEDFLGVFGESFLWSYGGSSGSMISSNSLGDINTYANSNKFNAIFTANFGSYFGDYDFENNYLRVILGSGKVLSTAWVGAPNWYFHPMGMGFDLGFCTRLTQNNEGLYYAGYFPQSVTVNLLGDPTLTAFIVKAPEELTATQQGGNIQLSWSPAADELLGYQVYRKTSEMGHFMLLNEVPTQETFLMDSCVVGNTQFEYLVRAVKREVTPSGSYINRSSGPIISVLSASDILPVADFELTWANGILSGFNLSVDAMDFQWLLPDGTTVNSEDFSLTYSTSGTTIVRLVAANSCFSDTLEQSLVVTDLQDVSSMDRFKLFPNPAKDFLILETQKETDEIVLLSVLGENLKVYPAFPVGRYRLEMNGIPNGIYLLKIKYSDQHYTRKILVQD